MCLVGEEVFLVERIQQAISLLLRLYDVPVIRNTSEMKTIMYINTAIAHIQLRSGVLLLGTSSHKPGSSLTSLSWIHIYSLFVK